MNFSLRLTLAAVAVLIGISTLAAAATFAKHRAQAAVVTASR
ncbi:MAG: hypothetical protein ACK5TH_12060 [Prosthecobacter sp.]|jgi:hypothetical protein